MYRFLLILLFLVACTPLVAAPPTGLKLSTTQRIDRIITSYANYKGRKILVTDFDGTLIGQRPNYAGNEFLIDLVEQGLVKNAYLPCRPEVSMDKGPIENFLALRKTDHHLAYEWRTRILSGLAVDDVRHRASIFLMKHYRKKIFTPMRQLLRRFKKAGWEVWVVTATTEWIVDRFIEREYRIPANRVIGVRTIVYNGRITDKMAGPVTDEEGKVVAIDTFIKARPLVVLGNSMGDVAMMKVAKEAAIVVNPEPKLRKIATDHGWLIESMHDLVLPNAPHAYKRHGGWPTRAPDKD